MFNFYIIQGKINLLDLFNVDPALYDKDSSLLIDSKLNVPEGDRRSVGDELKKFYTNSTFSEDLPGFIKVST